MSLHRCLVAIVDDDPNVLESFEELLASAGYGALLFTSPGAFLDADGLQQVDCLISDIGMPAINGWELLRIARTERPALPVILITAQEVDQSQEEVETRGARRLFRKPVDGPDLVALLNAILRPQQCGP